MAPILTSLASIVKQHGISALVAGGADVIIGGSGITATGGIISDYTDPGPGAVYRAHIFTSLGNFNVSAVDGPGEMQYLLVGGGGGTGTSPQGQNREAGSGAGGFLEITDTATVSSYPISIGAGGAGGMPNLSNNGANTTGFGYIAYGGGGGGHSDPSPTCIGNDGGSGGGGWYTSPGAGGAGTAGQGYPGSPGFGSPIYGGGGGGAGGAGGRGSGGPGAPNVYAYGPTNPVTYATGGSPNDFPGGNYSANATFATGNGGSGRGHGGSGIAVVRYQISSVNTGTAKATGGAISFYGGKTIHTFTSSDTFTTPGSFSETVEYFVVAGGAAGGNYAGGGGGAGGIRNGTIPISGPVSYPVSIGAGGARTISEGDNNGEGRDGNTTSFGPISVGGGGGGGSYNNPRAGRNAPGSGGSGGGGGSDGGGSWAGGTSSGTQHPGSYPYTGSSPATGWGTKGGDHGSYPGSAGGGGAGQSGYGPPAKGGYGMQAPVTFQDPKSNVGDPAPGAPSPGGKWFGGGGDGWRNVAPVPTTNPYGGGGYYVQNALPMSPGGLENTGGGGSGGSGPAGPSGQGGSGIVLVAYPT